MKFNNKIQVRSNANEEIQFRAAVDNDGKKIIEGYCLTYNTRSKLLYNSFYEIIERGAFDDVLSRNDLDVVFNFNHNNDLVMARTINGTLQLKSDDKGLYFRATLPDTNDANDLHTKIQSGLIRSNSFAFLPDEKGYTVKRDGNYDLVTIKKVAQLRDCSAVVFPAYEGTSLSARNDEYIFSRAEDEIIDPSTGETEKVVDPSTGEEEVITEPTENAIDPSTGEEVKIEDEKPALDEKVEDSTDNKYNELVIYLKLK